ncbi:MAG: ribosomal protein S18-alanine N-acetyltransferase [Parasporobacterium sp.]|nr:ribosomal protein S18-alanine N-acetyltransferase [Parasporobacterium sp.]
MEISYYEMSYDDIPKVAEMEQHYFSIPWSEAGIGHYMDAGNTLFLTAKKSPSPEDMVGYLAIMCILDEGELVSIAVDEELRGMGIASELLDIAYDMCRERGVNRIHLEVRESNTAAINLYEKEGFIRDGRRKGFYAKPAEDALLYTKELV